MRSSRKTCPLHCRRAGFSLVEMLIVIAIVGILAGLAVSNMGTIHASTTDLVAHRNAQQIAQVLNAAIAAGVDPSTWPAVSGADLVNYAEGSNDPLEPLPDLKPTYGPFSGRSFSVGDLSPENEAATAALLTWDPVNDVVGYVPTL